MNLALIGPSTAFDYIMIIHHIYLNSWRRRPSAGCDRGRGHSSSAASRACELAPACACRLGQASSLAGQL
jgi:hypothetical protein